jgi:hypothetical protein
MVDACLQAGLTAEVGGWGLAVGGWRLEVGSWQLFNL